MLSNRPDSEADLDEVKDAFRYQLQEEFDDGAAFMSLEETSAYAEFDDQLTDVEMADIFCTVKGEYAWKFS